MDPAITQPPTPTPTTSGGDNDGALKDPTNITKGKRTKRQRPTILTHSSTSYNAFNPSPTSSSDSPAGSTTTEDEDTANCLILLSKGHNVSTRNNNNNNNKGEFSGYKFNSKRYIQTSSEDNGLAGVYVYECKTCSRTFASFQALGGHRASHTKPRINEPENRKPSYTALSDEDELSHRITSSPVNTKKLASSSKLHDCAICGAEFNSGQALGGHMRRHRAANGNNANVTATNTTLSLIPYSPVTTMVVDDQDKQKSMTMAMNDGLCLDLDLNLPAPPEITVAVSGHDQQRRGSRFEFTANQNKQQPTVHLSAAPTLVDCHY